jgi:hypothetical protein
MAHFFWLVDGSIIGLFLLATMVAGVMIVGSLLKPGPKQPALIGGAHA